MERWGLEPRWLAGQGLILYELVTGLALFMVPGGYMIRLPLLLILYLCAPAFAATAIIRAARRSEGLKKQFWTTLAAGIALRVLGDMGWAGFMLLGPAQPTAMLYQAAWMISYVLLFVALGLFVARVNRRLALLAAIDSIAVSMTVGLMAYYFVIQPILVSSGGLVSELWIGFPSVVPELLRRPAADITLFFLTLTVLSADRPLRYPLR